ncbi:MAG: hypothetical protein QNJ36_03040 [Calothrix sp. MO_167.B42]|nr:hypothetical protein [Calothrix sp. MO_167.B42]
MINAHDVTIAISYSPIWRSQSALVIDRKRKGYKPPDLSVETNKGFYHYSKPLALDMGTI